MSSRPFGLALRRLAGDPQSVDIALYLRTCVTDDRDAAVEWLRRDITGYAVADVYRRVFRHFGFAAEVDAMHAAWQRGDREAAKQADHRPDGGGFGCDWE